MGRYIPSTQFLPERWAKSQITMEINSITSQQMKELHNYLLSGSSFSTHWEPVGWIKLLMDTETSLAYHKLVEEKAAEDSVIPLDTLLELLNELLLSRMSLHVRRKDLLRSF